MATFMIDYENVNATNGLKGAEYLEPGDSVYLFYSQYCGKIKAEYMEEITKSSCQFHICRLKNTGKNALDFYIATQIGVCIGQGQENHIAIISKDKGYRAVIDFLSLEANGRNKIVLASSIEQGIIRLDDEGEEHRCNRLKERTEMLDLSAEYAKYEQKRKFAAKIRELFSGTEYEGMTDRIVNLLNDTGQQSKKKIYIESLHNFGRDKGRNIYRVLRDAV